MRPGGAPTTDWQPGDRIAGLYDVQEILGRGGMGVVYRVRHLEWEVDLAVKVPRAELRDRQRALSDFVRECETWSELGLHPHAVTCYYVRHLAGLPTVFAEYVPGGSLADCIRSRQLYAGDPAAALSRILSYAAQIAWGLAHAHGHGLVHQDVKPANILLSDATTCKVTDFGLARAEFASDESLDERQGVTAMGMTQAYASPEQHSRQRLTAASDVWSWALTTLEMFCGELRWLTGIAGRTALQEYHRTPPDDPVLPHLPRRLATLLERCLAPAPADRPNSMLALAEELVEIHAALGRPLPCPRPVVPTGDTARWLNNRAISLLDLGQAGEAEPLWDRALAADPLHPESVYNHGLALWRLGRLTDTELLGRLQRVLEARQEPGLAHCLLAQIHLERGDRTAAAMEVAGAVGTARARLLQQVLERQTDSFDSLRTWRGHQGSLRALTMLPETGTLATAGEAGVQHWSLADGGLLREAPNYATGTCLAGRSANGLLVVGTAIGELQLWSGDCCRANWKAHEGGVVAVAWVREPAQVASLGTDGALRRWQLNKQECPRLGQAQTAYGCLAATPDGQRIVAGSSVGAVELWELGTGYCEARATGQAGQVKALAVDPNARFVVSCGDDRTVRLWSFPALQPGRVMSHREAAATAVAVTPDGRWVVTAGSDGSVRFWDPAIGRCLRTLRLSQVGLRTVAVTADPPLVLTIDERGLLLSVALNAPPGRWRAPVMLSVPSSAAAVGNAAKAYELALKEGLEAFRTRDCGAALEAARTAREQPDCLRRREAAALWGELYQHHRRTTFRAAWVWEVFDSPGTPVRHLAWHAERRLLVAQDQTGRLFRYQFGAGGPQAPLDLPTPLHSLRGLSPAGTAAIVQAPDGELLLCELGDGSLRATGLRAGLAALTPDHAQLATLEVGGWLQTISTTWFEFHSGRLRAGRPLRTGALVQRARQLTHAAADNAGNLLSAAADGRLFVFNTVGTPRVQQWHGHHGEVTAAWLDRPAGLVWTADQEGVLVRWDPGRLQPLWRTRQHQTRVVRLQLTTDGQHLLSSSADGHLIIWSAQTGEAVYSLLPERRSTGATAASPDGQFLFTTSPDGSIHAWFLDWDLVSSYLSTPLGGGLGGGLDG